MFKVSASLEHACLQSLTKVLDSPVSLLNTCVCKIWLKKVTAVWEKQHRGSFLGHPVH